MMEELGNDNYLTKNLHSYILFSTCKSKDPFETKYVGTVLIVGGGNKKLNIV